MTTPTFFPDARFLATHNSYSGGARGGVPAQLDAGVRGLELDVVPTDRGLAIGHGRAGWEVSHGGGNPDSDRLQEWFVVVRDWMERQSSPGPAPITLLLDLKMPRFSKASAQRHRVLQTLSEMLEDTFGARLFLPQDFARADRRPPIEALRGRVFAVVSGDRRSRELLLRDRGGPPAVTALADGRVLEIHHSRRTQHLWYWSGRLEADGGGVRWLRHGQLPGGWNPAVAANGDGRVVVISHPERGDDRLVARVGRLDEAGVLTLGGMRRVDEGQDAGVRFVGTSGERLVAAYQRAEHTHRFVKVGTLDPERDRVQWRTTREAVAVFDPHTVDLPSGATLRVRADDEDVLQYTLGAEAWRRIVHDTPLFVEIQQRDHDWMKHEPTGFCGGPATDAAWARARSAAGCVTRLWGFSRHNTTGRSIHYAATDNPHDPWYRRYAEATDVVV